MKVDIIHNINPEKLDYAIRGIDRDSITYLVMNERTSNALATDGSDRIISYMSGDENYYSKYKDIPIAVCNKLSFG